MVPFSVKCDYVKGVCVISGRTIKMPSDAVSLVTTGLGVSLLAGIFSGVCYALAHGIGSRKRTGKKKPDWYCEICGTYLHSNVNILNEDLVACSKCGAKVCTEKCAKFIQHTKWVCNNCLKPSESWFTGILKAIQPNTPGLSKYFGTMINQELQPNPELDSLQKLEKEQVRDFIEKLVNVMLGENVDNASVSMLFNDNHYKQLFDRYHQDLSNTLTDLGSALHISMTNLPVTGQSPCTAHSALKRLIEKLLNEAVNLPLLEKAHAKPTSSPEDTTNSTYEDLLATAIINKVVTSCQNNLPSSSANSISSRISTSSRNREDKEYFFGEETLDRKWKTRDLDSSSVSSLEEWLQSESSFGSKKYVDKVTLMIKHDIEEADQSDLENEEDDAEYFRSSSSLLNDSESNWYLQRRQFEGTHSPVPVPMLVPNPSNDAKVLIGDKPLDDTSDLSDVGSDFEESVQPNTTHSLLLQSKNIIGGGKNNFENVENVDVQSESSTDSGVKEVNGKEQTSFDVPESSKTDISLDDDNVEDSSFISVYSNTEKEAEYTEKYASLPRQILKTSTPQKSFKEVGPEPITSKPEENDQTQENGQTHEGSCDFEFVGGNYSKKEKEKWTHAVEMKNNPYSKENIERRIKRSNSAAGSIFGSDYYAKLSRKPAGGQKLHPSEINGVSWPPPESSRTSTPSPVPELPKVAPPAKDITETDSFFSSELPLSKEFLEIDLNSPPQLPKVRPPSRESIETFIETDLIIPSHLPKIRSPPNRFIKTILDTPPEPPKTVPPPREFIETNGIHQALKAIVTPVDETMPYNSFESQVTTTSQETTSAVYQVENYTVQTNTTEVTSDSDTSFINFYDVEHSQVVKKSKHEDVHIPIKATPLGVSYRTLADQNETNFKSVISDDHDEINVNSKEVPVAKPRVLSIQTKKENGVYFKAPVVAKQRNIYHTEKPILRRNLSESSLIEASFDAPPKVMHQKKDNTLISKIYKDPKVRLFALHSREEIPGTDGQYVKPVFQTQRSFDFKVHENASLYLSKGKSYNSSEDGITSEYESGRTGKMSFFSSEEDLLSLNSELSYRPNDAVAAKNEDVKLNGTTYKDDLSKNSTRTPSPNALTTPKTPSTRKFIYSSQEDLLSIDESGSIPQRKDNTLISKIYQNANVRNFALKTHRDFVSGYEPTTPATSLKPQKVSTSYDEHYFTDTKFIEKQASINKTIYSSYDDLSSADISLETHQINHQNGKIDISLYTDQLDGVEDGYKSEDLDIGEIAKRHVVREALGKFSKSEANIKSAFHRSMSGEDDDGTRVSVRDLRKKFENNNVSSKPVISSLTARSLSKQVKESLKQQ